MMHNHITIVAAGAAAHFVTGWVLSSHILLGKIRKEEKKAHLSKDMHINLAAQALVSLILAIAVAVAISIFDKACSRRPATSVLYLPVPPSNTYNNFA